VCGRHTRLQFAVYGLRSVYISCSRVVSPSFTVETIIDSLRPSLSCFSAVLLVLWQIHFWS